AGPAGAPRPRIETTAVSSTWAQRRPGTRFARGAPRGERRNAVSISVGSPLVNYKLAVQSHDRLLAQFRKMPTYARAVEYYRQNIGKAASVDDLLNDRRLLQVALSAFQLEDEIDSKGLIKKLLTEDPTDKKSVA